MCENRTVSRDRGGDDAPAARESAPQAIETADCFPLWENLTEAAEKALTRWRAERRKSQKARPQSAKSFLYTFCCHPVLRDHPLKRDSDTLIVVEVEEFLSNCCTNEAHI